MIAPPYDVIDAELQEQLYEQAPGQRRPADPQPRRAGRRRAQQPLHARRPVPEQLAQRRRAVHASPIRRSTSITRCSTTAAQSTRAAASWPACGWSASAKARSTRTKKRMSGPKQDRLLLDPRLQGKPQPDLRPVSRRRRTQPRTCSKRPSPASRRSKRPTTWASSIASGR